MKTKRNRLVSLFVTLCMVLTMAIPASVWADTNSDDIVILYTNDVHTYIDGELSYDVLAGMKTELEEEYNHVLLVDAGDHIQGTAYGGMDKGETIIKLMNAAGYDLATLGNHEFDYGMDGRIKVTDEWAAFPYISCNFYEEAGGVIGNTVFDASKTFENLGKWDVKFIGITTPESFTKSTPAYFQDGNGNYIYGIAGGDDGQALYTSVQDAIGTPEDDDIVIALGHLGDDPASQPWTSEEVIANTSGLDAFIDGHSHSTVEGKAVTDESGSEVLLTQTGEYFKNIGMMVIDAETGEITTQLISAADAADAYAADADVKAIKDAWMADIEEQLGTVIGAATVTFDNYDENGQRLVRMQGTNTGAFAADALYYLFDNMDMDVDVAVMNGGGVRNGAITGEISYKICKDIHTFGNVACLQTVTGQQILDALEWGARDAGVIDEASGKAKECGGFLHASGLTYDVDTSVTSTVQMDDKGVWIGGPTGEYRVKNVQIYDKDSGEYVPIDLEAKYNLAGYNYTLRDLGDGFAMFDGAVNVLDYVMEDYLVLANYVQSFPVDETTGLPTITAENSPYGQVTDEERIDFFCGHSGIELEGVKDATCTEAGYTGDGTCGICGETVIGEVIDALGHDYVDGACAVCGEAEVTIDAAVVATWEAYLALQDALGSGDLTALTEALNTFADAFDALTDEQAEAFVAYAESLGYDAEDLADQMFTDIIISGIITEELGELYEDFINNPNEETAKALAEYYEEMVDVGFDAELFDVFFGAGALEAAYEDALTYLGSGEGETQIEGEQAEDTKQEANDEKSESPETGDDTQMLFWLGLMMAAAVALAGVKNAKRKA